MDTLVSVVRTRNRFRFVWTVPPRKRFVEVIHEELLNKWGNEKLLHTKHYLSLTGDLTNYKDRVLLDTPVVPLVSKRTLQKEERKREEQRKREERQRIHRESAKAALKKWQEEHGVTFT